MKTLIDDVYTTWKTQLANTPDGDALDRMTTEEITDAFSGNLSFGTGGLRGVMGLGTNRMNRYTVERVTHGLAKTILSKTFPKSVGVAYDVRHSSAEFARNVCDTLSAYGIETYIFSRPMPTPTLSFAIRYLGLGWGVVITASHNPREYNGYKVYDSKGIQLTDQMAAEVTNAIETVNFFETPPEDKHIQTNTINPETEKAYLEQIVSYAKSTLMQTEIKKLESPAHPPSPLSNPLPPDTSLSSPDPYPLTADPSDASLVLVYSALHGTGANTIPDVLRMLGFNPICIQQNPDGDFGGLKTPNPEEPIVYAKAIEEAEKKSAKLLCATDPDCDRVGVMVKTDNGFKMLTGNQIGALLIDYLVQSRGVSPGDTVISTIVSGLLGELVAKSYGLEFKRLLTGFKYIGEYAEQLPDNMRFFFGYEESYGFLAGDGARDKDAVISVALIAQMAEYYNKKTMTLLDRWQELSEEHGYCLETLHSASVPQSRQKEIMEKLREAPDFEGLAKTEDYLQGLNGLPRSDVIKLYFNNGGWAAIRPSGTEPKIKLYTGIRAKTLEEAEKSLETITNKLLMVLEN